LGVPLFPADSEAKLPHVTLEQVEVVQSARSVAGDHGPFVRWRFVSGTVRAFRLGEKITIQLTQPQQNGEPLA
jgi:hypothetical protein